MEEGLDSLGTTELSDALQSQLGVELPSTFVFNNPTIADMSHHLHSLLSPEMDIVNERKLIDTKAGDSPLVMQLSIVGMSCHFPGGVTTSSDYWKLILDANHPQVHLLV